MDANTQLDTLALQLRAADVGGAMFPFLIWLIMFCAVAPVMVLGTIGTVALAVKHIIGWKTTRENLAQFGERRGGCESREKFDLIRGRSKVAVAAICATPPVGGAPRTRRRSSSLHPARACAGQFVQRRACDHRRRMRHGARDVTP